MARLTPLLLVRHAVALRSQDWLDDDFLRPLSPKGRRQADGLVDALAAFPVARILSSPALRCVQTVEPLAAARGLRIEQTDDLAEGARSAIERLLDGLPDEVAVLCSHGDVIPDMLRMVPNLTSGDRPTGDGPRCQKGSTWVVERLAGDLTGGHYLPPPS